MAKNWELSARSLEPSAWNQEPRLFELSTEQIALLLVALLVFVCLPFVASRFYCQQLTANKLLACCNLLKRKLIVDIGAPNSEGWSIGYEIVSIQCIFFHHRLIMIGVWSEESSTGYCLLLPAVRIEYSSILLQLVEELRLKLEIEELLL